MISLNFRTTTALYVGAKNVYLAQLKGTIFGPRLVKFGQAEIAAAAQADESARRAAIVQAIKGVLQKNKISAKRVLAAIPGKEVLIRYFQMPNIPKKELATAIKFESKKYIPFKIEELTWDFHVIFPKDKGAKLEVTFVAVKKDIIRNYLSLIEQAGLKIQALEPAPFSLLRLFASANQLAKDKPTAIVDVDYGLADINIVKNRSCYLTRDISLPLEAELVFDNLLNEIRMSLDYYEKLFPAEVLGKVLLSGEVERQDWDRRLSEELKMPVERVDLAQVVKIQKVLPAANMAVVFGLALRGLAQKVAEVNLYQVREAAARPIAKKEATRLTLEIRQAVVRAVILSGLGLLVLFFIMRYQIDRQRRQIEQVSGARPEIELPISGYSYSQLAEQESLWQRKLAYLNLLIGERVFWTEKFNQLPKIIPPGIWLTELTVSENVSSDKKINRLLSLKGVAYHEDPVREIGIVTKFVDQLQEDKQFAQGFAQIKLEAMASAELADSLVKNFTISCFKK